MYKTYYYCNKKKKKTGKIWNRLNHREEKEKESVQIFVSRMNDLTIE
jgi:hypothetical protein